MGIIPGLLFLIGSSLVGAREDDVADCNAPATVRCSLTIQCTRANGTTYKKTFTKLEPTKESCEALVGGQNGVCSELQPPSKRTLDGKVIKATVW